MTRRTQGSAPQLSHTLQWGDRQPPTGAGEGHDSYLRKPRRDLRAEEGAGEPKRSLLVGREGEEKPLRRLERPGDEERAGDLRPGEPQNWRRLEKPEDLAATSTMAWLDLREEDEWVSETNLATASSENNCLEHTAGAERSRHLCTSEK